MGPAHPPAGHLLLSRTLEVTCEAAAFATAVERAAEGTAPDDDGAMSRGGRHGAAAGAPSASGRGATRQGFGAPAPSEAVAVGVGKDAAGRFGLNAPTQGEPRSRESSGRPNRSARPGNARPSREEPSSTSDGDGGLAAWSRATGGRAASAYPAGGSNLRMKPLRFPQPSHPLKPSNEAAALPSTLSLVTRPTTLPPPRGRRAVPERAPFAQSRMTDD